MSAIVQKPLRAVPAWLWVFLALALAAQIVVHRAQPPVSAQAAALPAPPPAHALALVALGDRVVAARLANLYLQTFDAQPGVVVRYRDLDYARVIGWLATSLALDPLSQLPLLAAARVYAEVPGAGIDAKQTSQQRAMLEFVAAEFEHDPNRRWEWLAHAAYLAKHRLKDLPLALRYAKRLRERVTDPTVPSWVRDMEIFILEDMSELDQARVMLGGLLASSRITDPQEIARLAARLKAMEAAVATVPKPRR